MPSTCTFEFDRPNPIYYSGETINGRAILQTSSEKSVRKIRIELEGEAKVRWTEQKSRTVNGKTQSYTEHYHGEETYVHNQLRVMGEGNLPPGAHVYNFCMTLPESCPSSCDETYGRIYYKMKLTLDRPLRFDNVFKQPITVLRQLNLNLSPELALPVNDEDIKTFCCWPCTSGKVISELTIPYGGYAPGQKINYSLVVDNRSQGYDIDGVKLKLVQVYNFTAHYPHHKTREHTNTLTREEHPEECLRLSKRELKGTLEIPPIPPTCASGIISVTYRLECCIRTGSCHSDSDIWMDVTIGTVPLAQSATNASHVRAVEPTAPTEIDGAAGSAQDKPPTYDVCMPPTYEAATTSGEKFVDNDENEYDRHEDWVPKYPTYMNFAEPSAPTVFSVATAPPFGEPTLQSAEVAVVESQPLLNATNGNSRCPYPVSGAFGGMPALPTNNNN